ncbi:hypothetical protein AB0X56_07790 [Weissella paramesenteroides]|uniref:hypothetical protein n=1 Tax=Weissella paramesenteroides TaxID=1249 RepID=UPI003F203CA3
MYWKGLSKTNKKRLSQTNVTPLSQINTQPLSETNKTGLQDLLTTENAIEKQERDKSCFEAGV